MRGIEGIISMIGEIPFIDREEIICSILESYLKDNIDPKDLFNTLKEHSRQEYSAGLKDRNPQEIMDEYCEIFSFEDLVDELNYRIEYEEEEEEEEEEEDCDEELWIP